MYDVYDERDDEYFRKICDIEEYLTEEYLSWKGVGDELFEGQRSLIEALKQKFNLDIQIG